MFNIKYILKSSQKANPVFALTVDNYTPLLHA